MADFVGSIVGAQLASVPPELAPKWAKGGAERILMRDTIEVPTAFAQNDRVVLGAIRSDAVINPLLSMIWFDDLGTSITMDVGDATTENKLVAAQDVATAAGSCSLYKSVDIADYAKPLWQVLSLTKDPKKPITLYAKLEGGDPGTGTITWQIVGQPW